MEELIDDFCKKTHCSFITLDFERLNYARKMLDTLHHNKIYDRILHPEKLTETQLLEQERKRHSAIINEISRFSSNLQDTSENDDEPLTDAVAADMGESEEEAQSCLTGIASEAPVKEEKTSPHDMWLGYFNGFEIINETQDYTINENKKCIELRHSDCKEDVDSYLRSGIRCYAINLFAGTAMENQTLIVRLRESEIRVSTEFGFPVTSTLYAHLSPRLQYVGLLSPPDAVLSLAAGDEITLTTDRYWSTRGSERRVYVNARFLIDDVNPFDFLLVGAHIQLCVKSVLLPDRLRCTVMVGGDLRSRLPVLFPGRCNKFRISAEELEDITFAKEVGINVIVSHTAGTKEYFDNLQECLSLLQCEKMRVCARVVLNELRGTDDSLHWVADCYDGLCVEFNPRQPKDECENEAQLLPARQELLHICPLAVQLLERVFKQRKPIIMDATPIAQRQLIVTPDNFDHIFYQPDKYVVRCDRSNDAFYFDHLQSARSRTLSASYLTGLVHCDASHTGSDSLARACVAAAHEVNAAFIIVDGFTGRMAAKIAHWRPNVPILFVTSMKSAADFISMFHHVIMLYYSGPEGEPYRRTVFKRMILGLMYGQSRKILSDGQYVILVYGHDEGTKCPDKYIVYKYRDAYFPDHLKETLFSD